MVSQTRFSRQHLKHQVPNIAPWVAGHRRIAAPVKTRAVGSDSVGNLSEHRWMSGPATRHFNLSEASFNASIFVEYRCFSLSVSATFSALAIHRSAFSTSPFMR